MKLSREEFQRTEEKNAHELFEDGIRAEQTRFKYNQRLKYLLCKVLDDFFVGSYTERVQQLVDKSREDPAWVGDLLLNIAKKFKTKSQLDIEDSEYMNPETTYRYFQPLRKLFEMNNVVLAWKRIYNVLPDRNNCTNSYTRGWSSEEIRKILELAPDVYSRTIILMATSSGMRSGALENLDWQDLFPIYYKDGSLSMDCKEGRIACVLIRVYRGTKDEYPTFISPEAYQSLMQFKRNWTYKFGREPLPTDPIFYGETYSTLKRARSEVLTNKIYKITLKAGLRNQERKRSRRFDVPLMNGFRRFHNKQMKSTSSRDSPLATLIRKEFLMGHQGLFSMDKHYFQSASIELAEEYIPVLPKLTISNELRLREEGFQLNREDKDLRKYAELHFNKKSETIRTLLGEDDFETLMTLIKKKQKKHFASV